MAYLAQVNSGSDGSDGTFNPKASTNIDMTVRPSGIYQYASVNIPSGVTVTFTPNVNNTPVVWLVQGNVVISGSVQLNGQPISSGPAGVGGAGGYRGGNPGGNATSGQGPGGGAAGVYGGNASYGTLGAHDGESALAGPTYGNNFLIPLLGGSGGGGSSKYGGGGGGGAILIASSSTIQLNGGITAGGGGWV